MKARDRRGRGRTAEPDERAPRPQPPRLKFRGAATPVAPPVTPPAVTPPVAVPPVAASAVPEVRRIAGPIRPIDAVPDRAGTEVLESALRTVLHERQSEWSRAATSDDEARRLAGVLLVYLRTGEVVAGSSLTGAEKSLIRRLIDLTRHEVLSEANVTDPSATLRLVRDLDRASVTFEPGWNQALASSLTGANALDLVVELAHDLRSPLTSIMFLSETVRKGQSGEVNDVQRKQLGIVYSAALGLVTMASDLMDLAREQNESNFDRTQPSRFSLAELIDSVRLMVLPMAEEKRLDLAFLTPDHDVRLGKSVPISRVLLNLVTNAMKFTETGRIEMVARETAGSRVEFSVIDSGRGIAPDVIATMFEPFQRSESSTGFHFSGTGLGLSICRRMVELLGGELKFDTTEGVGTRFHFEIDLPRASRI